VAHVDDAIRVGICDVTHQRSTTLATRAIRIARSALDARAGVIRAAMMVTEATLKCAALDRASAFG
jgi:hypothetical protein